VQSYTGARAGTSELPLNLLAQVKLAAEVVWEAASPPGLHYLHEVAVMISELIHLPSCCTGTTLVKNGLHKAPQPSAAPLNAASSWPSYLCHEEGFSAVSDCHVLNSLSGKKT